MFYSGSAMAAAFQESLPSGEKCCDYKLLNRILKQNLICLWGAVFILF